MTNPSTFYSFEANFKSRTQHLHFPNLHVRLVTFSVTYISNYEGKGLTYDSLADFEAAA